VSSKLPMLYHWEYGVMFGARVIRGYLADGRRITRQVIWQSHGQVGVEHQAITGRHISGHYRLAGLTPPAKASG
jgi:hypothetical protein